MSLKDLNDDQIALLLTDQDAFMADDKNKETVLGFDSATKRRFADVLKYELKLTDAQIKHKLDEAAMIRLKEIDIFN